MLRDKIEPFNAEINYYETQQFEYDFDTEDRPVVFGNPSFAKIMCPQHKAFTNLYNAQQTAGGQAFAQPHLDSVASNYIGQCENQKMKIPLFQVKWMKEGKRVVTSSNKGQLIVWDALNFDHFQSCDVHRERVYAMAWTNY